MQDPERDHRLALAAPLAELPAGVVGALDAQAPVVTLLIAHAKRICQVMRNARVAPAALEQTGPEPWLDLAAISGRQISLTWGLALSRPEAYP